ncbi:phage holin family protein [Cloacibacterium sp.]|jgi:putative membrane protein|uniref:phage holin family protein n=1 Tax=Cloacibacterium sp. TaxID=1913682 RepID=UPI0035B0EE48
MKTIIKLLITALVAYFLPRILSGVHVADFTSAIIFAIVLGLLNLIVKPILQLFSLPITIITLGLFSLVINALITLLAAHFTDGIHVDGFWWAFIFSIALSIITSILESIFISKED